MSFVKIYLIKAVTHRVSLSWRANERRVSEWNMMCRWVARHIRMWQNFCWRICLTAYLCKLLSFLSPSPFSVPYSMFISSPSVQNHPVITGNNYSSSDVLCLVPSGGELTPVWGHWGRVRSKYVGRPVWDVSGAHPVRCLRAGRHMQGDPQGLPGAV